MLNVEGYNFRKYEIPATGEAQWFADSKIDDYFTLRVEEPFPGWYEVESYDPNSYDGTSCFVVKVVYGQHLESLIHLVEVATAMFFYEWVSNVPEPNS